MNRLIGTERIALTRQIFSTIQVLAVLACSLLWSFPISAQIVKLSVLEEFRTRRQHFSCSMEYAPEKCMRDLRRVYRLLEQYNAEGLGAWQWVIVSRSEWKPLCVKLGVDFLSPAMTSFADHQTFLDEALFDVFPDRANELVHKFGASWKDLLTLAVTHELGHAVCRDVTEMQAEFFAGELRRGRPGRCESTVAMPVWSYRASPGR
jgi:hypothetical protein